MDEDTNNKPYIKLIYKSMEYSFAFSCCKILSLRISHKLLTLLLFSSAFVAVCVRVRASREFTSRFECIYIIRTV
jgi:hypothetical protein